MRSRRRNPGLKCSPKWKWWKNSPILSIVDMRIINVGESSEPAQYGCAIAQNRTPANTLMDIRRQFSACLEGTPIETGSVITITFAMKRDGSLLGKPRFSYSPFNGDVVARRRFVEDVHDALNSCLPLKITPALGARSPDRFSLARSRMTSYGSGSRRLASPPLADRPHGSKRRMYV